MLSSTNRIDSGINQQLVGRNEINLTNLKGFFTTVKIQGTVGAGQRAVKALHSAFKLMEGKTPAMVKSIVIKGISKSRTNVSFKVKNPVFYKHESDGTYTEVSKTTNDPNTYSFLPFKQDDANIKTLAGSYATELNKLKSIGREVIAYKASHELEGEDKAIFDDSENVDDIVEITSNASRDTEGDAGSCRSLDSHNMFEILGEEINNLRTEKQNLEDRLITQRNELEGVMNSQLAIKDNTIADLQRQLELVTKAKNDIATQLTTTQSTNNTLTTQVTLKENTITELNWRLEQTTAEKNRYFNEVSALPSLVAQNNSLRTELSTANTKIKTLQSECSYRNWNQTSTHFSKKKFVLTNFTGTIETTAKVKLFSRYDAGDAIDNAEDAICTFKKDYFTSPKEYSMSPYIKYTVTPE